MNCTQVKNKSFLTIIVLIWTFFSNTNCEKMLDSNVKYVPFAVASSLFNNRMLLLLKGTYATDNPIEFTDYSNGTGDLYMDNQGDVGVGDPNFDLSGIPKANQLPIYIDVGEIRISSKYREGYLGVSGLQNAQQTKKFWDYIATSRQVYCNYPYTAGKSDCEKTGLSKLTELFNGDGAVYPSNDPTADENSGLGTQYYYSGVYIRALVTGWARFNGTEKKALFDNYQIAGENIVFRNNYRPGASLTDKESITPEMFPLFYGMQSGQADMSIRAGSAPYILEIRFNLKENLMVHSYSDSQNRTETLIGVSDWNYTHTGEIDMGGNILSRARVIYPDTAAKLQITGGTKSKTHYYSIYRKDETDILKRLPLASSPVTGATTTIKYIHDGDYILYCIGDTARVDGMPDTIVRQTNFSVPANFLREVKTVDLTCP